MNFKVQLTEKDWVAIMWIGLTQISAAWIMALWDLVYAPIPMFAAAVVAGFLFKGRPKEASLAGALAGLLSGGFAEWAFHVVRIQNRILTWAQLKGNEQLGLAIAEMLLYASLLSFFAAFFSWGASKEETDSVLEKENIEDDQPKEPLYSPVEKDQLKVDMPLFKEETETDFQQNQDTSAPK